jgi:hypothetical protein
MRKTLFLLPLCILLSTCDFFKQLLEPEDIVILSDKIPPIITISSHTNKQQVYTSVALSGFAIDKESGINKIIMILNNKTNDIELHGDQWSSPEKILPVGNNTISFFVYDNNKNVSFLNITLEKILYLSVSLTNIEDFSVFTNLPVSIAGIAYIDYPIIISKVELSTNNSPFFIITNGLSTQNIKWKYNLKYLLNNTNTLVVKAISGDGRTNFTTNHIVYARTWLCEKKYASDGALSDEFGYSVGLSTDGTSIIVGARNNDDKGNNSGSFYLYKWNGIAWSENIFIPLDGIANANYGHSVGLSSNGNIVITGVPYDDDKGTQSGSVYLYRWEGGIWKTNKFIASDGLSGDNFGQSVSISAAGNVVAIGAMGDDIAANPDQGSVYVYKWNGTVWAITNKLITPDGAFVDRFGYSVFLSADGNVLAASARDDDDKGSDSGSVYAFIWNGGSWVMSNKFVPLDGAANDSFGYSISLSQNGSFLAVGSPFDDDKGVDSGSVYIFRLVGSAWETNKITASDGIAGANFGFSVSVSKDGNSVLIGAKGDDDNGSLSGSVYLYKWNGSIWMEKKFSAYDGAVNDWFGVSVSLSADGNKFVIGNKGDNGNTGSVYYYEY